MPPKPMSDLDIVQAEIRLVNYYRSLAANPKRIRRNKWRPDPKIDQQTQVFEGILGAGGFGSVHLVHNTSTNIHHAVKIQSETIDQRTSRNKRRAPPRTPPEDYDRLAHTPPITPSSEATILPPTKVAARSLVAKNYRENRTYLQYVKSGHPNICALEAFLDFTSEVGGPEDRGGRGHRGKELLTLKKVPARNHPPELFIWHTSSQLIGAVAFLHNEHPDYKDLAEHQDRAFVTTADLASTNVFLKWPVGERRRCYPDVKVGDLGGAYFLPKGGRLNMSGDEVEFVWAEPPEDDVYDGKTDVWSVGVMMYMLGVLGKPPTFQEEGVDENGKKRGESDEDRRDRESRQRKNPKRVGDLMYLYSAELNDAVRTALTMDKNERPSSGTLYMNVQESYRQRLPLMFRQLHPTLQETVLKHKFPENRISELVAGDWERENNLDQEEAQKEEEIQDREAVLMWVEKDRKLRFGFELEEWEEGFDEEHAMWLKELMKNQPSLFKELLNEARKSVPSP